MATRSAAATKAELRRILACDGVRAAVIFLNSLTAHRFTALYRFDDATLHNVVFCDCENLSLETTEDIPVLASYCVFVRDRNQTFTTSDSHRDEQLAGHPKRDSIRSYCGVPLLDPDGTMFGSICHFDFRPMSISDANVTLMEAMAPLIRRHASARADHAAPQ